MATDYPLADYLLVLEPPPALDQTIRAVKKHFAETYECPQAAYSKAHITLLRFTQYIQTEARLLHRMEQLIRTFAAFPITLSGFGSFPTHTIFIQVETRNDIVALVKGLRPIQSMLKLDQEHKPHYITEPHLSIARKLLPWQYEKGWLELSHTDFTGRFMAKQVLLLRKKTGDRHYETIRRFQLEGIRQLVEQTALF